MNVVECYWGHSIKYYVMKRRWTSLMAILIPSRNGRLISDSVQYSSTGIKTFEIGQMNMYRPIKMDIIKNIFPKHHD